MDIEDVEVFVGIDVGKAEHWATALTGDGKKLFDKALPNSEDRLREVYQRLGEHGRVLVAVDQPATIGALAVAVAQDMGITVGYLPGLSMRRIADQAPGQCQDRREGRRGDRRRRPHHAPHSQVHRHFGRGRGRVEYAHRLRAWTWPARTSQTEGPYPGPVCTQTPPSPRDCAGQVARTRQRAGGDRRLAHPRPPAQGRAGAYRRQAPNPTGADGMPPGRRPSPTPWASRPSWSLVPTRPGWCCPTRHRPAHRPPAPNATMSPPRPVALAGGPPSFCPAPDHPCPGVGVPAAAVFLAETAGRTFPTGAQLASYAGLTPVTRRSGSSIRGEVRLPRGQQAPQTRHVPVSLRIPQIRPRIPGLLRTQTRPGQAPQPSRTRPRPPPHPHPIRHDPPRLPLRPTSPTTTHRRLTNHIGAPPGSGAAGRECCPRDPAVGDSTAGAAEKTTHGRGNFINLDAAAGTPRLWRRPRSPSLPARAASANDFFRQARGNHFSGRDAPADAASG